jgi:hypothetical protein
MQQTNQSVSQLSQQISEIGTLEIEGILEILGRNEGVIEVLSKSGAMAL